VKCGVFANAFDAVDADPGADPVEEGVVLEDPVEEGVVLEDLVEEGVVLEDLVEEGAVLEDRGVESVDEDVTTGTPDGVADVPFAAKSAARVRSASRTNPLLPVRSARR